MEELMRHCGKGNLQKRIGLLLRLLNHPFTLDFFLLGLIGPKDEAMAIKQKISEFLSKDLKLELNAEKTLVMHARDQKAKFLGYEIHVLHEDSKHDHRGQRCINGSIGLRIPHKVKQEKCAKYMKHGKPKHMPQRTIDEAFGIVSQYQAEYRGVVQYYRMAYNLHTLGKLKHVTERSLVQTLASKYKTTCSKIYRRYGTKIMTEEGERKVLLVKIEREVPKKPLIVYFGGVSLKWNKWVSVNDKLTEPIWSKRSEVVPRLLAQECELCGTHDTIEVHHIRQLADLKQKGRTTQPEWKRRMAARYRKSLAVCQKCHQDIHYGKYDGRKLSA